MSWEHQKENIQPLAQGRKINTLMRALSLVADTKSRKYLLDERREKFEKELEENKESPSKQLDLWSNYIDWLEQNEPEGGKVNGLSNAVEQCIEQYYSNKEFKQDERLFDIFMKFKRFCDEPVEVFSFMYANSICTLLARFYLNWSWQYEIRKNMTRADDLLKLGLKNLASPRDVLEEARSQLRFRLERLIRNGDLDETPEIAQSNVREIQAELVSGGIRAALNTLKFKVTKKKGVKVPVNRTGIAVDHSNVGGLKGQTKMVNGVRVAKKIPIKARTSNIVVKVFSENGEQQQEVCENVAPAFIKKMPTLQPIREVGRSGLENRVLNRRVITDENMPPPSSP